MKLEITKEKVLEAASKCSQARETLKNLFPEVFDYGFRFSCDRGEMDGLSYNKTTAIIAVNSTEDLWVARVLEDGKIELATNFWDFKVEGKFLIPTLKNNNQ